MTEYRRDSSPLDFNKCYVKITEVCRKTTGKYPQSAGPFDAGVKTRERKNSGKSVNQQEPDDNREDLRRYGGLGADLVANTMVGLAIGYLLDRWLGTTPWLMIAGLVLGSAAGFLTIFRAISEEDNDKNK